jgi:hypothetical protein
MYAAHLVRVAAPLAAQPPVKKLTVTPAAAPQPSLRYELLPKSRQRTAGNAAVYYLRAALLRPAHGPDRDKWIAEDKAVQAWEDAPIDKLPVKDVRAYLDRYTAMFRAVEAGSRCERCDWQLDQTQGMELLIDTLPSVQANREIARYLSLRIKLELAENRPGDALRSVQTGLRLGQRVGEGPILIQMLVGIALTQLFLDRVEDLMSQPDSPNLYWALSTLPRPFINPRPALEGEARFFDAYLSGYDELRAGPIKPERAREIGEQMLQALRGAAAHGDDSFAALEPLLSRFGFAAYVALHYESAKNDLLARGRQPKDLNAMPPAQVVLLNAIERVKVLSDNQMKWFLMPIPQGYAGVRKVGEQVKTLRGKDHTDVLFTLFSLTVPATQKVFLAHARTERNIAALRTIEAIRLHAAAHDGTPPAKLSDVTAVPVPSDPLTGEPFRYTAQGNTFTLTAPPPTGEAANPSNSVTYDVTISAK